MNDLKNRGFLYAFLAYFFWGFFPLYWKLLSHVPLLEILSHRVLWAFVFYTIIIGIKKRSFISLKKFSFKDMKVLSLASVMLMANWLLYIYAVNSGHIIESSLGYFINPLVNILFGVIFFKEKLNKHQIISAFLASIGVLIITFDQGRLPWIAITLAITFAIYGSLKKISSSSGTESNQFESFIFVIPAIIYLATHKPEWIIPSNQITTWIYLIGSGVVTGLPLIFFAEAAQKIPYYLMGFFQFIAPSLQFLCGYVIFSEPLSLLKLKGFVFIWAAVLYLLISRLISGRIKKR